MEFKTLMETAYSKPSCLDLKVKDKENGWALRDLDTNTDMLADIQKLLHSSEDFEVTISNTLGDTTMTISKCGDSDSALLTMTMYLSEDPVELAKSFRVCGGKLEDSEVGKAMSKFYEDRGSTMEQKSVIISNPSSEALLKMIDSVDDYLCGELCHDKFIMQCVVEDIINDRKEEANE